MKSVIQSIINFLSRYTGRQLTEFEKLVATNNGYALDGIKRAEATKQAHCTHRKGGYVRKDDSGNIVLNGTGHQYAVIKHQHLNGDMWVECLRCGRKWKPPLRSDFRSDRSFYEAVTDYEEAVAFETNNVTSTSIQFGFRLNGSRTAGHEFVRKQMANS
jgi:hypothetical protein